VLLLAELIRDFRLKYPPIARPEPVSRLTLRPKNSVRLIFDNRD
jgi:hypothetical protein